MEELKPEERHEHLTERPITSQDEEEIDNGRGVFIKAKTLYHGSGTAGIKSINVAEEDTIGAGAYFTSEAKDAIGYARRRARPSEVADPVLYEAQIENLKLMDLRKDENVKYALAGFRHVLLGIVKDPAVSFGTQAATIRALEIVGGGKIGAGNLREATFSFGKKFSEYIRGLGYDGLIAYEGGEGDDIGFHDTYLIFDPARASKVMERKVI